MEIGYEDFKKVLIKIGTVLEVKKNEKARKPSLVLKVDFGKEIGIKQSSAQITHYYSKENLIGKQVIGVCNFPKKNIAGIISEVLILGAIEKDGKVGRVKILRGIDKHVDKACVKVVEDLPEFSPGKQIGKAVPVKYTVPIKCTLG